MDSGVNLSFGQYGYKIVIGFINNWPRSPTDLDIIVVRKEGAKYMQKDFRVRRALLQALQWLKRTMFTIVMSQSTRVY